MKHFKFAAVVKLAVFIFCCIPPGGAPGAALRLAQGQAAPTSTPPSPACSPSAGDSTTCSSFNLAAGASPITSNNLTLSMEANGNLVLHRSPGKLVLWESNTAGSCADKCMAALQPDGNLVLYKNGSTAYWNTATYGNPGAVLVLSPAPPYLSIRTTTPKLQPFVQFGKTTQQSYRAGQVVWGAGQNLNWLAPVDPFGGYGAARPGAPDFMQLFQEGAPGWQVAFSHINVVKLYTQNFQYFQGKVHSPENLRTIIEFLKAHHIALAIEAEPVTCINQTVKGEGVGIPSGPAQATEIALEVQSLGGTLAYAAMDEPVDFYNNHAASCPLKSLSDLAENVANFYAAYQAVFPAIQVGDVEFGMTGPQMAEWAAAYRHAAGVSFAFFHDDAFQPGWGTNTAAVQAALKGAEGEKGAGIPYGLIRNSGQPPGTTDTLWVSKAKRNVDFYNSLRVPAPAQNIFQTWEPFPTRVLPETGDTLTNVVNYVFKSQKLQ